MLILGTICLSIPVVSHSSAAIGPSCEPRGLIARAREAWDPRAFWEQQTKEIANEVEAERTGYRLSMIERRRGKLNAQLDAEEMEVLGIEQYVDPELDRELASIDRELLQFDREMLKRTIDWGRKCTEHARRELRQAR